MHSHPETAIPTGDDGEKLPYETGDARRILLVEDYEPIVLTTVFYLEQFGYDCKVARTGLEALEEFSASRHDLVLLDLQLPDIDGFETARRMRAWEADRGLTPTPIIAATGKLSADDRLFCMKAGMNDCLSKPYRLEVLEEKIRQWLQSSQNT